MQKKQKAEEKRNWASIRACVERGEEKSRLEWEHFRSRELEEKAARALAKSKCAARCLWLRCCILKWRNYTGFPALDGCNASPSSQY